MESYEPKAVMIDLHAITRTFLRAAICLSKREHEVDAPAIEAVHDRNRTHRKDCLKNWLQGYRVFQGLVDSDRLKVAKTVLEFADENGCDANIIFSHDLLMAKFDELHNRCRKVVRVKGDGTQRDLTSLTSKALWCCYPNAVPLYDRFAQKAVWLISRLARIDLLIEYIPRQRYRSFTKMWFTMCSKVLPLIEQADLEGYPYKVRVFDKILWIVGEQNYNRDPRKIGLAPGAARE